MWCDNILRYRHLNKKGKKTNREENYRRKYPFIKLWLTFKLRVSEVDYKQETVVKEAEAARQINY